MTYLKSMTELAESTLILLQFINSNITDKN